MSSSKINTYAFKTTCILICVFMLLASAGMFLQDRQQKGVIALVTACIVAIIAFRRPLAIWWITAIIVLLASAFIVGAIK